VNRTKGQIFSGNKDLVQQQALEFFSLRGAWKAAVPTQLISFLVESHVLSFPMLEKES